MNSPTPDRDRRRCLQALPFLALWPEWLGLGAVASAAANAAGGAVIPPTLQQGWQRWGQGDYRRFGFLVYRASLWGKQAQPQLVPPGNSPSPPYALLLDYQRDIDRDILVEASLGEMQRQSGLSPETLKRWGAQLAAVFPNVQAGAQITGLHLPGLARFYLHSGGREKLLGEIADARFPQAFFAIWLAETSSAPALRRALLGQG